MISLFFSYSHKDEDLKDELEMHLVSLERQGILSSLHDRKIGAGNEFDHSISKQLEAADIILLLISPYFIASEYCYEVEMKRALEKHECNQSIVIPVILRPCCWQGLPFGKLLAFPKDGRPIKDFRDIHSGFLEIVKAVKDAVELLSHKKMNKGRKKHQHEASFPFEKQRIEARNEICENVFELITNREDVCRKRNEIRISKYGPADNLTNVEKDIIGLYALRTIFEYEIGSDNLPDWMNGYFDTLDSILESKSSVIKSAEKIGWFDSKGNFTDVRWAVALAADHLVRRFENNPSDGKVALETFLDSFDKFTEEARMVLMSLHEWWEPCDGILNALEKTIWACNKDRLSISEKTKKLKRLADIERFRHEIYNSPKLFSDPRHPARWALRNGLEHELPHIFTILNENRSEVYEEFWEKLKGDAKNALAEHTLELFKQGLLNVQHEGRLIKILSLCREASSLEAPEELKNDPVCILQWLYLIPKPLPENVKGWMRNLLTNAPRSEIWGFVARKFHKLIKTD